MRAIVALALLIAPAQALAYGPGVHVREAGRALELIAADDPVWAEAAATPGATTWLRAGAIAPDFQWITDKLGFGHSKGLSYHLLDAADTPQRRLFALGHLAHICSDASAETFLTPTLFASEPLGMFDLFAGFEDARGESEGICEGVGDFVFGDWDAVIDVLYDVYLGGPEAEALFVEIFDWYCVEGSAYTGKADQCAGARADVEGKLDQGKSLLGGFDRAGAKSFLHDILDAPLNELLGVFGGGFATALLGSQADKSVHFDEELARAKTSALADPAFWDLYEQAFVDLGPRLTVEHLELRPTGWPGYEATALISGNLQSILRFLPTAYAWGAGLHVDDVTWAGPGGEPVDAVDASLAGQPLTVRARLFAGLPFVGTVTATVRKDVPGFATQGPVVAEATLAVDLDPARATTEPRPIIEVPFTADTAGALGFVLELTLDDEARPWFTTSFDRAWTIPALPLHWSVYTENFGTYGHWPPSLPVTPTATTPGALLVEAHMHPAGKAVAGALVTLVELQSGAVTTKNGVVWFDTLPPGEYTVEASGAAYVSRGSATATVSPLGVTWAHLSLEAVPNVAVGATWTAEACVPFTWDAAPFTGLATGFEARTLDYWSATELTPPVDIGLTGAASACLESVPDGARAVIAVRALYPDGPGIAEGASVAVGIDRSGPAITKGPTVTPLDPGGCLAPGVPAPTLVPVTVAATWEEPHSFVSAVQLSLGEGPWIDVSVPQGEGPWTVHVDPAAVGATVQKATLRLRLLNGAGVATVSDALALPVWGEERRCPVADPGPDAGPDAETDAGTDAGGTDTAAGDDTSAGADTAPEPGGGGGDDGCGAAPGRTAPWALLLLLAACVHLRRRTGDQR